nr:glycoside hydrolase family 99-like domain-containing protein [Rhodanobacter glycinis]
MTTATRDRLRQHFLEHHASMVPKGPRGQLADQNAHQYRPHRSIGEPAIGYRSASDEAPPAKVPATLIAFYLPQFHAIPENNAWWGEGFTEWRNVARALPQFEGHVQPRLPGALGFYDLTQPMTMRKQMQLARTYGIGAFCSYFYWFAGKTLLEQPLCQWLDDPSLELPLCLCWANENWSRRWDGRADNILISQQHSPADDLAFIEHVSRYLKDPRYLRIDGKPLLLLYRPSVLPEPKATAQRWRQWCHEHGVGDIHLAYVQSFDRVDPRSIGFDAAVEFPPNNITLNPITGKQRLLNPDFRGDVHDWRELARSVMAQPDPVYPLYPCVNPGWDNEPRRSGAGRIFAHASPRGYRDWLRHAIATSRRRHTEQAAPPVFINAWNEWAEGAVLEPDTRLGHAWLHATRTALCEPAAVEPRPCAIVHAWYPEVLGEVIAGLRASNLDWRLVVTTAPDREAAVRRALAACTIPHELVIMENHGRDILPFLRMADRLLDEGVQIVVKMHTKRSTHRQDGDIWRRELLDKLLAPSRAPALLAAFAEDPTLGLIAPEGHLQPIEHYWGANRDTFDYLARRLGMDFDDLAPRTDFIAGSMFWARLPALRPLLDAQLAAWEFEAEAGQIDGTFAHAIERMGVVAARNAGFHTRDAASLCGIHAATGAYPYAKRG